MWYNIFQEGRVRFMRKQRSSKYERYFEEVERLYVEEGLSQRQIGERLGIGKEAVHHIFRKYLTHVNTNRTIGDYTEQYRKYQCDVHFFDVIDTPAKAYFLGLIYADGYIPDTGLYLTIEPKDRYILESFCDHLQLSHEAIKEIDCKSPYTTGKIYPRLEIYSSSLASTLHKYGAVKAKSLVLQPPVGVPEELIYHFIRGFFDGNGSIYFDKSTGHYKILFTTTYAMCEWLEEKLHIETKIRQVEKICRCECGGNTKITEILSELYEGSTEKTRLERKYLKYLDCKERKEYQDTHRKETWIKNLGPYIRNGISGDCELSDQQV